MVKLHKIDFICLFQSIEVRNVKFTRAKNKILIRVGLDGLIQVHFDEVQTFYYCTPWFRYQPEQ